MYYLIVELAALAIALSALTVLDGTLLWVSIGLGGLLLGLGAMDLRHMVLVDSLNLVLALSGLTVAALFSRYPIQDHVIGTIAGASALYVVNRLYRALRGRDGLGMGDVKLMAGAGAWLGWQGLPSVLLYGTAAALVAVVIGGALGQRLTRHTAIPFGTFLCFGIWMTWLLGPLK
jgi:leader peptidase (prepilin peptidase) / N-methyltransferase